MKKKFLISALIFVIFSFSAIAKPGFEFGIGSGHVFYGSSSTKSRNSLLEDKSQIVLATDASILFPYSDFLIFSAGLDTVFDFRWHGGNHINLCDYSFLIGTRIYPNLAGFFFSIDYALGRRTDFISIKELDDKQRSKWGNGFKLAVGYDFSHHMSHWGPVLVASLKSMPRGNSRDNILSVSLKFTKHK